MKNIRKEEKISFKARIFFIIIASIILTFSLLFYLDGNFKGMIQNFMQSGDNIEYKKGDFESIDYLVDENHYISQSIDPQLIVHDITTKVNKVTIYFSEPIKNSLNIQTYYDINKEGFSEDRCIVSSIQEGAERFEIILAENNITDLRLDVGTKKDDTFKLDKIVLNEKESLSGNISKKTVERGIFLFIIIFLLLSSFILFDFLKVCEYLFQYRWYVAGIVLLFLVLCKYSGNSLAMYDSYIQPGEGSEYVTPLFGVPRGIRSDEWLYETANKLGVLKSDSLFEKYNTILRGTETLNSIYGLHAGLDMLAFRPDQIVFLFLPLEYAFSFVWYFKIILTFMLSLEMGLIITKRKKLLSVAMAFLLGLSPWYLWWNFPIYLISAQGCIVCANYFLNSKKTSKKIFLLIGLTFSLSTFITNLYPAWQVPIGYLFLAILIWFIHENWNKLKNLTKKDILLIIGCLVLTAILVSSYFISIKEYTNSIMNTVYPGSRRVNGYNCLWKYFQYFQSILFPYKNIENPSELAGIMCFFPIPLIWSCILFIKQKKKDWFLGSVSLVTIILLFYTVVALPEWFTTITLINFSLPERTVDIVNWAMVYLLFRNLSYEKEEQLVSNHILNICTIGFIILAGYSCKMRYLEYMSKEMIVIITIIYSICAILLFDYKNIRKRQAGLIVLIGLTIITGSTIRPISKGLDSIYSKPVAKKIEEIVRSDEKGKWITLNGFECNNFLVACGASTLNSTNAYPNMKLYQKLDSEGKYEEIYNRYAHIIIELTNQETNFENVNGFDLIRLNLSYKDLEKIGVSYIFVNSPVEIKNNSNVQFLEKYSENGARIYQVKYN